jgi:hypothetical protein
MKIAGSCKHTLFTLTATSRPGKPPLVAFFDDRREDAGDVARLAAINPGGVVIRHRVSE